ncbi:MAG: hypothetical protein H6718_34375 [Polyangiaceae bacterium]|nr:hypothetical protein [Myxococcales bacterium]MCB9590547.1 hypothetical protein [Polyangiaceae bacterium]
MLNPHGKTQLARTLLFGAALYALAGGLTWATDEVGASWGQRAARIGALGPLLAGIATWLSGQLSRLRGEARALLALGVSPSRLERGAVAGGWILAALGLVLALGPWATQASLFPAFESGRNWQVLTGGTLVDPLGARFDPRLGLTPGPVIAPAPGVSYWTASVGLLLPLVLAVPPWVVDLRPSARRLTLAAAALLASVAGALWLLHGVAASRLPWPLLLLTPLPLGIEYRLRNWRAA